MLHEALRLIRVFNDLKQVELADRLGISTSHLSEIEKGKKTPSLDLINKYSEEFHMPMSAILFFSEEISKDGGEGEKSKEARTFFAKKALRLLQMIESKTSGIDDGQTTTQIPY